MIGIGAAVRPVECGVTGLCGGRIFPEKFWSEECPIRQAMVGGQIVVLGMRSDRRWARNQTRVLLPGLS